MGPPVELAVLRRDGENITAGAICSRCRTLAETSLFPVAEWEAFLRAPQYPVRSLSSLPGEDLAIITRGTHGSCARVLIVMLLLRYSFSCYSVLMQRTATAAPAGFLRTTHKPDWLTRTELPLFIADQNLRNRAGFPRARGPWVLDSGGFMQLKNTGRWQFTVREYVQRIATYMEKIGNLAWAAPMDYMCEDDIRAMTGFRWGDAVLMHQHLSTENYMLARQIWPEYCDGPCLVAPVLQGWLVSEYENHMDLYGAEGIDLQQQPIVGLGSVCRRSSTPSIIRLVTELSTGGLKLHGFGVKREGLRAVGHLLHSADSMAWSIDATHEAPLPGHTHKHCGNCFDYAMQWCDDTAALFTDPDYATRNSSLYAASWS